MAVDKQATLKKLEEFNRKADEAKQSAAGVPPLTPVVPGAGGRQLSEDEKRILTAEESTLSAADRVAKKALQTQQEQERAARERAAQEKDRERREDNLLQRTQQAAQRSSDAALDAAEPPVKWLEGIPTPMGLGIILAIIGVFLLAVVPVDSAGHSRLWLMWMTITGKTHLSYQDVQQGAAGASGGFGSQSTPAVQPQQTGAYNVPVDLTNIPDLSGIDLTGL